MYSKHLSDHVIKILHWAPVVYLTFGFWMCSIKQMLSNDFLEPKELKSDADKSSHLFHEVIFKAEFI